MEVSLQIVLYVIYFPPKKKKISDSNAMPIA